MANKKYEFSPDYVVCPGETLQEVIEDLGMTLTEFAQRTGLTPQSIIRIIKGEQPITPDSANRLELVTGTPARFWNNLESLYQEQSAKIVEKKRLEQEVEWLKIIPFGELVKRNLVQNFSEKYLKVREALRFFGVSSVEAWNAIWEAPAVAARRSSCFETRPGSAATWIRLGEVHASQITCLPYDKTKFRNTLNEIRKLTNEDPSVFIPEMTRLCAAAGVAVALVKELPKVPWSGATKWLSPNKAMILLNLRGKSNDLFWFSFFHEAAHILHDSKKDLYINSGEKNDPIEVRADSFAADFLIPEKFNTSIQTAKSKASIVRLAKEIGVSPGIVAGRFQYLNKNFRLFNDLKTKFEWGN